MDLLKEIGSILGFVAFGGLAVLVFMTFQQARHVRRLREWAGRSPERSAIEAERVAEAAQEASIARAGGDAGAAALFSPSRPSRPLAFSPSRPFAFSPSRPFAFSLFAFSLSRLLAFSPILDSLIPSKDTLWNSVNTQ